MAYQITQINDLEQDGLLFTTFILVDTDGEMPEIRLDKVFMVNDKLDKIIENQKKIDALFYENEYYKSFE